VISRAGLMVWARMAVIQNEKGKMQNEDRDPRERVSVFILHFSFFILN
jgi:hypothetical protein